MDNAELKRILREQKIPMQTAVSRKIEYLKSEHVFQSSEEEYLGTFLGSKTESDDMLSFQQAFENVPGGNFSFKSDRETPQESPQHAEQQGSSVQNSKPMSVAQRIAALRGAMNMSSACMQYQKK